MSAQGSITQWLQAAEQGDEQAAQALWERYYTSLLRLARSRLGRRAGLAVDEQDVVLNAFDAFYRGFQSGRFPQINDRHDLWRLLITLTGRKAVDVVRREHRQKRGAGQVIAEADLQPGKDRDARPNLADFIGSEPSPEFALMLAEDLQRRIDNLPK
jgi:DNA-directed RNA polymerase specialized sigma24 family protein